MKLLPYQKMPEKGDILYCEKSDVNIFIIGHCYVVWGIDDDGDPLFFSTISSELVPYSYKIIIQFVRFKNCSLTEEEKVLLTLQGKIH